MPLGVGFRNASSAEDCCNQCQSENKASTNMLRALSSYAVPNTMKKIAGMPISFTHTHARTCTRTRTYIHPHTHFLTCHKAVHCKLQRQLCKDNIMQSCPTFQTTINKYRCAPPIQSYP